MLHPFLLLPDLLLHKYAKGSDIHVLESLEADSQLFVNVLGEVSVHSGEVGGMVEVGLVGRLLKHRSRKALIQLRVVHSPSDLTEILRLLGFL